MLNRLRRWFYSRTEALDILKDIRRQRMLYRGHPEFRDVLNRIQDVLDPPSPKLYRRTSVQA